MVRIGSDYERRFVLTRYSSQGAALLEKSVKVDDFPNYSNLSGRTAIGMDEDGAVTFLTCGDSYGTAGRFSAAGNLLWSGWDGTVFHGFNYYSQNPYPLQVVGASAAGGNHVFAFNYQQVRFPGLNLEASNAELMVGRITPSGAFLWSKQVAGPGYNMPTAIVVDADGNIYLAGFNTGSAAFDQYTLPARGGMDGFVVKYDSSGNVMWVRGPVCSGDDSVTALAIGQDGNLWLTGKSASAITLGGQSLTGSGNYLASYTLDGAFRSAVRLPTGFEISQMQAAPDGTLILLGTSAVTQIGSLSVPNQGGDDVVVVSMNTNGTPVWAKSMGYVYKDFPAGLSVAPSGAIYVSGSSQSGVVCDGKYFPGTPVYGGFIAKLAWDSVPQLTDWPRSMDAYLGTPVTFSCTVMPGSEVSYQWFLNDAAIPNATNATYLIPSTSAASQGSYYVEVTNESGTIRSPVALLALRGQVPILVTTIAGGPTAGYVDANRGLDARFNQPNGLATWNGGMLMVADVGNSAVRLLEPGGAVVTYAGRNLAGSSNGPAALALFNHPLGVTVERSQDVLVADTDNNVIRRVSAFGLRNVTTFAGSGQRGYLNGPADQARFDYPNDLVADGHGNIFVTEWKNHTVRRISMDGTVSTVAGDGTPGGEDGVGAAARFNQPGGIAMDSAGQIYVTEWSGHRVRKISPAGLVTTLAGNGSAGFVDGPGDGARFFQPDGITVDQSGNLFVSEAGNHAIRKVTPQGIVTTVAGLGTSGFRDGDARVAQFNLPGGITWHPSGSLFVADTLNHAIRRIEFSGNGTSMEAAALVVTLNPTLTIFGRPGAIYRIEAAEAQTPPLDWVTLDTVTLSSGALMWCDSLPATRTQRLYRAVRIQ